MSDDSLNVQAVVDQFRESEEALSDLRERLRSIVLAEEGAEHAAESIEAASTRLATTASVLEEQLAEMEASRKATIDALKAAQRFLSGTDFTALRAEITSSTELVREGLASIQSQIAELSTRIPQVEELRAEMEGLKERIPARTRKKMGV